ncbi:MAG: pyridoxamine 5'-phosphate oxidase family protein [Hyphomicrobiales bacterium]
MAIINEAVRAAAANSVLCWLATVDADLVPNVSPKEIFAVHGDDAIVIANIASPVSLANIAANPKVCVSFIDVFRQEGFKLKGTARVVPAGDPEFAVVGAELLGLAGDAFEVRDVILVRIEKVARILAPSFVFHGRSEAERRESAYRTYGVRPAAG